MLTLRVSGVSPSHVDVLMGTFTKSFGAAGGYIAADRVLNSNTLLNAIIFIAFRLSIFRPSSITCALRIIHSSMLSP